MSRLADPHFDDIYTLSRDIKENCLDESNEPLDADLESMVANFRVMQKYVADLKIGIEAYDSKTGTKANGYRSIIRVVATLVRHSADILETVKHQQSTLGYVAPEVLEDIRTWLEVTERLIDILSLVAQIRANNSQLYPDFPDSQSQEVAELSSKALKLDLTPFYGSALGFHLRGDSRRMMHPLAISMASYSDIYGGSIFGKIKRLRDSGYCWDYINNPRALAKKVVENSRNLQVDFAQSFYNLPESDWVSKIKTVPPIRTSLSHRLYFENFKVPTFAADYFHVPAPTSHLKRNYVQVRLVAGYRTQAMLGTCGCTTRLTCSCVFEAEKEMVILHVHGGGFVSQTSRSHLDYLHQWAEKLGCPILSVDYSLAPEAAYPRALEEVFYSYCWMMNNFEKCGTTGKYVILAGKPEVYRALLILIICIAR